MRSIRGILFYSAGAPQRILVQPLRKSALRKDYSEGRFYDCQKLALGKLLAVAAAYVALAARVHLPVILQLSAKLTAGCKDAALHCAHRQGEFLCDFIIFIAGDIHLERLFKVIREPGDDFVYFAYGI